MKTSIHVRQALKQEGLPSSYPTFRSYLLKGVIKKPLHRLDYPSGYYEYLFTDEEIQEAIDNVRRFTTK